MEKKQSSFKNLPTQIEWIISILIIFNTYAIFNKEGTIEIIIGVLTFLILLNGWISSKATSGLYSDSLLTIDIVTICLYFLLVLTYHESKELINNNYWLFSSIICACYGVWDIRIRKLVPTREWKKYYYKYIYYMIFSSLIFLSLFIINIICPESYLIISIVGILTWMTVLVKWHYDKTLRLK